MSEYAARQPDYTTPTSNDYLEAPDGLGTPSLFEQSIDDVHAPQDTLQGASATIEAIRVLRYPESASERKQALEAAVSRSKLAYVAIEADDERTTPYSELGGQRSEYESRHSPLEQVLLAYEPWMHDISMGVKYGLFDMGPADLNRMTVSDRDTLALYVDGYMEGLATFKRLVANYADVEIDHEFITSKYSSHGKRTKQELSEYSSVIDVLTEGLKQRGVVGKLQQAAFNKRPSSGKRHEARKRDKRTHNGATPHVVFDQDKPRIQRLVSA